MTNLPPLIPKDRIVVLTNATAPPGWTNCLTALRSLGGLRFVFTNAVDFCRQPPPSNVISYVSRAVGTNLPTDVIDSLYAGLQGGMGLILEGESPLARQVGVQFTDSTVHIEPSTTFVALGHPDIPIRWEDSEVFQIHTAATLSYQTTAQGAVSVLSGGQVGSGKYLFLAAALGTSTSLGFNRFPFFHEALTTHFDLPLKARRNELAVYLDWGFHYADNPNHLADKLRRAGIREVRLSAWYPTELTDSFYQKFIAAAHARCMRVYCWLELPLVTQAFWEAHPEWRQRTPAGTDAIVDWRRLMALEIPECLVATYGELQRVLMRYDWDGVELAQCHFEAGWQLGESITNKDSVFFTPMSDIVRTDVSNAVGWDPISLFDPNSPLFAGRNPAFRQFLIDYRADLCSSINGRIMRFLKDNAAAFGNAHRSIILSQPDSLLNPQNIIHYGTDTEQLINDATTVRASMEIDMSAPISDHHLNLYSALSTVYRVHMEEKSKLAVKLSIFNRSEGHIPTEKPTGLELLLHAALAGISMNSVAVYSTTTTETSDWTYLPYTQASDVQLITVSSNSYIVSSGRSFSLEHTANIGSAYLDLEPWYAFDSNVIHIPSGQHQLCIIEDSSVSRLRVLDYNIDECSITFEQGGVAVDYDSECRGFIALSREPSEAVLDQVESMYPIPQGAEQRAVTYILPSGKHGVRFVDHSSSDYIPSIKVQRGSLGSTHLIIVLETPCNGSIEASEDLVHWTLVSTNKSFEVVLPHLSYGDRSLRFYRGVLR